ncbi:MAG: hypothetical protein CVU09_16690 [Bacteroidetes bacterium HGW-Bacteroidetes-4]|jgi:hypothetical protein|nr:MAG: hypothetical protein CVU09_16690 [Bacteroidetes bacterium HGW-Bacteroidetes-4]
MISGMAKLLSALLFSFITATLWGQPVTDSLPTKPDQYIECNTDKHDFGILEKGEKATFTFELTNKNTKPLVIWHVSTSCGCTSPNWTKNPVPQNQTANIGVVFDALEPGYFEKLIMVYTNFADKPLKLSITGSVAEYKSKKGFRKKTTNFTNQQIN